MNKQSGFIALISAIIISAILLLITVSTATSSYFERFEILDMEAKQKSKALAESCVNVAMLKISAETNYIGNETIPIGTENCDIRHITASGTEKTIETHSTVRNASTNMRVKISATTLKIISWEELSYF